MSFPDCCRHKGFVVAIIVAQAATVEYFLRLVSIKLPLITIVIEAALIVVVVVPLIAAVVVGQLEPIQSNHKDC